MQINFCRKVIYFKICSYFEIYAIVCQSELSKLKLIVILIQVYAIFLKLIGRERADSEIQITIDK